MLASFRGTLMRHIETVPVAEIARYVYKPGSDTDLKDLAGKDVASSY